MAIVLTSYRALSQVEGVCAACNYCTTTSGCPRNGCKSACCSGSHLYNPPPSGPSPEQIKREREKKDLGEAALDANDKGVEAFERREWATAIQYFKEALEYEPDSDYILNNLRRAQEEERKDIERKANREAERLAAMERLKREIQADKERYRSQLQRLMNEADRIKVPSPSGPRRIAEGMMLGLFDPEPEGKSKYSLQSPLSGKAIESDDIFATTNAKNVGEVIRGLMDNHYLGAYTLGSPFGKELVRKLQGTHFEKLIAHSNGATIAEALIRRGVIQVEEFNIVGGDRSMINRFGLQELIESGKVKKIIVWINPGDIIPHGSSSALLSPFGPAGSVPITTTTQYFTEVLTGHGKSGYEHVEYRILAGPEYERGQVLRLDSSFFDAHGRDAYFENMKKFVRKTAGQQY
jgi:hypothetical protein